MTYCVGMILDEGLVLMSDTRTNSGVDNISVFRKMYHWCKPGERVIAMMTAGNLATTQAVTSRLEERTKAPGDRHNSLLELPTMFQVAAEAGKLLRETVRDTQEENGTYGKGRFTASLIVAGQIKGMEPRLFMIYPEGNFIEASWDTPFFQIGETKYGRPILDREVRSDTPLADAVKCGFLSFDAAMASNLGVARPIDLMVMPTNPRQPILIRRVEQDDAYFNDVSQRWSDLLHAGTRAIPNPPFMS